ncbi:MAG TPA: hypothetical protein VMV44_13585 [Rectinemataceae bacterium]|nr:hypothetical protein [Rectinemataceae bacterium]
MNFRHKAFAVSALSLAISSFPMLGQDPSPWTFTAAPTYLLPLMSGDGGTNTLFGPVLGGTGAACYRVSPFLSLRSGASWTNAGFMPYSGIAVPGGLGEFTLLVGASTGTTLGSLFSLDGFLDGGLSYGMLSTGPSSAYAALRTGAGLDYTFAQDFAARLEATFTYKSGLYGAIGASLGLSWSPPVAKASENHLRLLRLSSPEIESVFPVLRSYYGDHPIGTVSLTNIGRQAATDVHVSVFMKQYMDAPKESAMIPSLAPGASVKIPLTALFNDSILSVTEATKALAEVIVVYGEGGSISRTATVLVQDRNALTWNDDRKAAAFVSSKDPWVLDLTGNFIAAVKDSRNTEVPKNLQTAMAIHEGLRAYGLGYVLSPNRPFVQSVVDQAAVDNLKFPRQTLGFRSGDCADLSVLYASCFEAVSIETAFITIPGHIFMAFDLGLSQAEAAAQGIPARDLIVMDDHVWIPIETTIRDKGFDEVWRAAVDEWKGNADSGLAAFYPIHDAWSAYAPVGLPADGSTVPLPARAAFMPDFTAQVAKEVSRELEARIAALGPKPTAADQARQKYLNDRGVLYGRYGRFDEAWKDFQVAARAGSVSALVNLGNIDYMRSDLAGAYQYYQQAAVQSPNNVKLLINLARVASALGKNDVVAATLARLGKLDPAIAAQNSTLSQAKAPASTRAAEVDGDAVNWL